MSKRWLLGMVAVAAGSLAACGSSPAGSDFHGRSSDRGENGSTETGSGQFGGNEGTNGGVNGTGKPACATASAEGAALPVYLVFMYDRSGSMDQNNKWSSTRTAMESFFASPTASNMNASLAFFPQTNCNPALYSAPTVAMRALPDASTFRNAIGGTGPQGATPTLPAVQGAIQYAQSVQQSITNGGKVAVVLVTDGLPDGCGSTPQNVAAEAARVASTIPTYVIGVGGALANLNTIAQGGGTKQAILVSDANPQQTTTDITNALGQIKNALSCEYAIPAPPNGQKLDYNAVNLVFTPTGMQSSTLTYNKDCTGGTGWHYDNPNAPSRILICQSSCDAIKTASGNGKVEIQFGCATLGGVAK
jgi:Mg-chelatase subunit ChlD